MDVLKVLAGALLVFVLAACMGSDSHAATQDTTFDGEPCVNLYLVVNGIPKPHPDEPLE